MTAASDPRRERLAMLVHEVRSPVAALSAIAETLAGETIAGAGRVKLARLASAACRAIERVVADASVATVQLEPVDVGVLVRQVVEVSALGGARVEARVAVGIPLVHADPVRLRQALDNLVSNALAHAGEDAEVLVTASANDSHILLSVSDSGIGVPMAEQERIFQSGVRLDPESEGSGLGLAVVQTVAEAHGGQLTLVSAVGEGATFTIALPVD
jgi:two-component system, OmpR family, sensor histidine kinase BaeS